jgi:glycosyltransferase involved in cell wall biosynthesis
MSLPSRIVHYCPGIRLELGGVVRAVLDWCSVLAARGNEVILATHDSPDVPAGWTGAAGLPRVVQLPLPSKPNWFVSSEAVKIWDGLMRPGSVAHLHCPWTASNIQMARSARRNGVGYVVSIHGMLNDWSMTQRRVKKQIFLNLGGRAYLRRADRIHYTAAAERDQAQKWIHGSMPVVLPYLVDLASFHRLPGPEAARAKFGIAGDTPVLLFLSRLHEKKGVHILIEAAALLRDSGQPFRLILAGTAAEADRDYEQRLRGAVRRLNLEPFVSFVGLVTGVEKISLYQAADLFVLPTLQENFGLVLVEAMACGTPVLTTRGTDIWQEIAGAGQTISDNAPAPLCAAMRKLLGDRAALAESRRRARPWVMERFDTDRLAGDYERLYAEIATTHRTAPDGIPHPS